MWFVVCVFLKACRTSYRITRRPARTPARPHAGSRDWHTTAIGIQRQAGGPVVQRVQAKHVQSAQSGGHQVVFGELTGQALVGQPTPQPLVHASSPPAISHRKGSRRAGEERVASVAGEIRASREWEGDAQGVESQVLTRVGGRRAGSRADGRAGSGAAGTAIGTFGPAFQAWSEGPGAPGPRVRETGDSERAQGPSHYRQPPRPARGTGSVGDSVGEGRSPPACSSPSQERSVLEAWGQGALQGALGALGVLGAGIRDVKGAASGTRSPRAAGQEGGGTGGGSDGNMARRIQSPLMAPPDTSTSARAWRVAGAARPHLLPLLNFAPGAGHRVSRR